MSNTHCRHGHPWNEENTRFNRRGDRYCIACQRAQSAAYRRKKGKKPRVVSLSNRCVHGHAMTPENTRVNFAGMALLPRVRAHSRSKAETGHSA